MENVLGFVEVLLSLVPTVAGAAIAIGAIIDGLKKLGWLPDGYAPLVSLGLNFAVYVALYFLGDRYGGEIQSVLDAVATVSPILVALLLSLLGSSKVHDLLVGIGLGFSHSDANG
jgi:hypothetical protein